MLDKSDARLSEGSDNEEKAVFPLDNSVDVSSLDGEHTEETEEVRRP